MTQQLVLGSAFNLVMLLIILANTAVLATYTHDQSEQEKKVVERLNIFFDVVFLIEMCTKLVGLGWRLYVKDRWNIFDGILVVVSVVELGTQILIPVEKR